MNPSANAEVMQRQAVIEQPGLDPEVGFDNRVHIKNAKTGRMHRIQHYARHSYADKVLFERPVGSGNAFNENGTSAGRWDFSVPGWKKIGEQHIAVEEAPANHEEYLQQQNAALRAELEQLKLDAKNAADAKDVSTVSKAGPAVGLAQPQTK